jgi:hypothetical protein
MNITINLELVIKVTTAPVDYDGFGTFTIGETYLYDREARIVAIRPEHVEWQLARYSSGMKGIGDPEECHIDKSDIEEAIHRKLTAQPTPA